MTYTIEVWGEVAGFGDWTPPEVIIARANADHRIRMNEAELKALKERPGGITVKTKRPIIDNRRWEEDFRFEWMQ